MAILGLGAAILVNPFPIAMRLLGFFPASISAILVWIMFALGFSETALLLVYDVRWRRRFVGRFQPALAPALATLVSACRETSEERNT